MRCFGAFVALLLAVGAHATDEDSGSRGAVVPEGKFVVMTVSELQDELLSTTDLDASSPVQVYSSYDAMQDDDLAANSLPSVADANATVFASILVTPPSQVTAAGDSGEAGMLSGRTQLYYNCTSAPLIWDLLEDSNVVALVEFWSQPREPPSATNASEQANTTATTIITSTNIASDDTIVATATLEIADCSIQRNYSTQQLLAGNAFFGDAYATNTTYFRVVTSSANAQTMPSGTGCLVRLELARAGLRDLYPDCSIKFHSTDLGTLLDSKGAVFTHNDSLVEQPDLLHDERRRRLGASSFGFVKHPDCSSECGVSPAPEMDQCAARSSSGVVTLMPCTLAFYATHPSCDEECGDSPRLTADLPPSQCYHCYYSGLWWCDEGYTGYKTDCCLAKREIELYSKGDCSDLSDLTSDCCRLTCLNCYANLTIDSMFADVDVYVTKMTVDAQMVVRGNTNITLQLFAPNGCIFATAKDLASLNVTIPLYMGLSLTLGAAFGVAGTVTIKPHGSTAAFGVATTIDSVSAGFKDFGNSYRDIQVRNEMHRGLKQAGLDASVQFALVPKVWATLALPGDSASIGVQVSIDVFAELQATVVFPKPMAPRATPWLDSSSLVNTGDCTLPHFMTYNLFVGTNNVRIEFPIMVLGFTVVNPVITLTPVRRSIIAGCVASAYETKLLLAMAVDKIANWTNNHQLKLFGTVLRALNFTDIDASSLELTIVSRSGGIVALSLKVPPSMVKEFPSVTTFDRTSFSRARSRSFSQQISSAVGIQMAAACEDGKWGDSCSRSCSQSPCSNGTCNAVDGTMITCTSCVDGYWGPMCSFTCSIPPNCKNAKCAKDTGQLICGSCAPGYWGSTCDSTCQTSSTCNGATCGQFSGSVTSCSSCSAGYWGRTCDSICQSSSTCKDATCGQFSGSITSCDSCTAGYWGNTCKYICQSSSECMDATCAQDSGSVTSCGSCSAGYWGRTCDSICQSSSTCKDATCGQFSGSITSCNSCAAGYWGDTCNYICQSSPECMDATCAQDSGSITSCGSCTPGYWGSTCDSMCQSSSVCKDAACAQDSGQVSCGSCVPGYWGSACDSLCHSSSTCHYAACGQFSGSVTSCEYCAPDYWGITCDSICESSSTCYGPTCAKESGQVSCGSCVPGYWGSACESICQSSSTCNVATCGQLSGRITSCESCGAGYWGSTCDWTCPGSPTCNDATCAEKTGSTSSCGSCAPGYWGSTCDSMCQSSATCKNAICAQDSGSVTSCGNCASGYWGGKCDSICQSPSTCNVATCTMESGSVTSCESCSAGYWGRTCENACVVDFSVNHCASDSTAKCDQSTGTLMSCGGKCAASFSGTTCSDTVAESTSTDSSMSDSMPMIGVVWLIVIALAVVFASHAALD